MSASFAPLPSNERITLLDIWRGFAIFGILAANMAIFMAPNFIPTTASAPLPWTDQTVKYLLHFLIQGKFFTIFSFLFGLGFALQLRRAEAAGRDVRSFYPRRLWALLGIGVLHYLLLWEGDILRLYALLGFILLAFRHRSNQTLLMVAASCLVLSALFTTAVISILSAPAASAATTAGIDFVAEARRAYTSPGYLDVLAYHARIFFYDFFYLAFIQGLSVAAMFLFGLYVGKQQLLENLSEQRALLKRVMIAGLVIGLPGSLVYAISKNPISSGLGYTISGPALAAVYLSVIARLTLDETWKRRLAPLAGVGRMALTNYVLQSVVCSTLFYGYGMGLYEKLGPAEGLLLSLLIFSLQVPFSVWWFEHFQYGPLEWLWRGITYGKRPPFLKLKALELRTEHG